MMFVVMSMTRSLPRLTGFMMPSLWQGRAVEQGRMFCIYWLSSPTQIWLRGENDRHGGAAKMQHFAHVEIELQWRRSKVDLDILFQWVGLNSPNSPIEKWRRAQPRVYYFCLWPYVLRCGFLHSCMRQKYARSHGFSPWCSFTLHDDMDYLITVPSFIFIFQKCPLQDGSICSLCAHQYQNPWKQKSWMSNEWCCNYAPWS